MAHALALEVLKVMAMDLMIQTKPPGLLVNLLLMKLNE